MCLAAGDPSAQCLRHGFMLHTKYQVVYPFPTFQPAFQLKKDQVVLLNTSYSLVACAVSVHSAGRPISIHRVNQETWLRGLQSWEVGRLVPSPPVLCTRTFQGADLFSDCLSVVCQPRS